MNTLNRHVLDALRTIAGWRNKAAAVITAIPAWPDIERAARTLTAPVRGLAHMTLRTFPSVRKVEWLFEVERLTRVPPVMLAVSLGFTLWRGLRPTSLGHIGTDTLIYPFIGALSYFNPFLGMLSGVVYGIGDLVQKLFWNDIYGAAGRGQNYWGAMLGYAFAYSALIAMGCLPGVCARVGALLARRAAHVWFSRAAVAAADGAVPIAASFAPSQPAAELFGSMIGAAAGGAFTMHEVAPVAERSAFYGLPGAPDALQRATPDVGCHALEVNTYLKGRAFRAGAAGTAIAGPVVQLATNPGQVAGPERESTPPESSDDPERGGTPPPDSSDESDRSDERDGSDQDVRDGATSQPLPWWAQDLGRGQFGAPPVGPRDPGDVPEDTDVPDDSETPTESALPEPPGVEEGRTTVAGTCAQGHPLPIGSTHCARCFFNGDAHDLSKFRPDAPPEPEPPKPALDEEGRTTVPGTCARGHQVPTGSTYCDRCYYNNDPYSLDGFTPDDPNIPAVPAQPQPTAPEPTQPEPAEQEISEPTEPDPTETEPTDPEPESADPEPTEPEPTDPESTEPDSTDPEPTEPESDETEPVTTEPVTPDPNPAQEDTDSDDPDTDEDTEDRGVQEPAVPYDGPPLEGNDAVMYLIQRGEWDFENNCPRTLRDGSTNWEGGYVPGQPAYTDANGVDHPAQPDRILVIPPPSYDPNNPLPNYVQPGGSSVLPDPTGGAVRPPIGFSVPNTVVGAPNPFEQTPSSQPLADIPHLAELAPDLAGYEQPPDLPSDDRVPATATPVPDRPGPSDAEPNDEMPADEPADDVADDPGPLGRSRRPSED